MNQMSFSVNLTNEEWKSLDNMMYDYWEGLSGCNMDCKQNYKELESDNDDWNWWEEDHSTLHKHYRSITNKIDRKESAESNKLKKLKLKIRNEVTEELSQATDEIVEEWRQEKTDSDESWRKCVNRKDAEIKELRKQKYDEIKKLKEQIDQQHKELQEIKDKLKSIIT
ncbi:MAG: hypothetical protein CMG80_04200 [Marinobacter sp.]|mgnify:CR=1 FL=1|nr:hypothetical protein [Marinobacter sp.]|tara:strand:- start:3182 stop:3685 length:504 start_codon:yes stop_codon:yes gene_type:complete